MCRINSQRNDPSTRLKTGPRLDGILRSLGGPTHEFCAIEAAPSLLSGHVATKWLSDKAKLPKVLRDMLSRLIIVSGHDADIARKLQVVGVSIAGLMMQVSRLCHGKGYVTLLVSEPIWSAPSEIEQITDLLELLPAILSIKICVGMSAFVCACIYLARGPWADGCHARPCSKRPSRRFVAVHGTRLPLQAWRNMTASPTCPDCLMPFGLFCCFCNAAQDAR
jgi:hypothetical protein